MNALDKKEVYNIQKLRLEGNSYKEIAKVIKRSPATVLKYSNNVILSVDAEERIRKKEQVSQIQFVKKYAKEKEITDSPLDEDKANLLGHLFFDGSVSISGTSYRINYTNASLPAIESFIKRVSKTYSIIPSKLQVEKRKSVYYQTSFSSKKLVNKLNNSFGSFSTKNNIGIPQIIKDSSEGIRCAFMRAFWDDEGSISCRGVLQGCSKSERMIDDLVNLHKGLGIKCTKCESRGCYYINISKKKANMILFSKKIGFEFGKITRGINKEKFKKEVLSNFVSKMGG